MELNRIYCVDCFEGLKQLEDNSIDLIITSPPYNKAGLWGKSKQSKQRWFDTINYNNNLNVDKRPESEYQEWQINVLNECYRVLKEDGSCFYNHKNRVKNGLSISPYEWLLKCKFNIRQEIVWDRTSTLNVNNCRYYPTTERIYWLTKSTHPSFKLDRSQQYTEVWKFDWERNNPHPAPFPITIPNNIIPSVAQGKRITILDPFMGSGTVAVSAIQNNCDYIGFELFQEYIDMAEERIKKEDSSIKKSPLTNNI